MSKTMKLGALALALSLGASVPGAALAEEGIDGNEAAQMQALLAAKTTALQAGQAAEAKVGGKVAWIEFEMHDNKPAYRIEVVTANGQAQDVTVDAATGEVTGTVADKADDSDDEQDGETDDDNG